MSRDQRSNPLQRDFRYSWVRLSEVLLYILVIQLIAWITRHSGYMRGNMRHCSMRAMFQHFMLPIPLSQGFHGSSSPVNAFLSNSHGHQQQLPPPAHSNTGKQYHIVNAPPPLQPIHTLKNNPPPPSPAPSQTSPTSHKVSWG